MQGDAEKSTNFYATFPGFLPIINMTRGIGGYLHFE
jgi:hypothetical protein